MAKEIERKGGHHPPLHGIEIVRKDVFQDRAKEEFDARRHTKRAVKELRRADPTLYALIKESRGLEKAREAVFHYLAVKEQKLLTADNPLHPFEKTNVRQCITVLRNIFSDRSEHLTRTSALRTLRKLIQAEEEDDLPLVEVSEGFVQEFVSLFKGLNGLSGIYVEDGPCLKDVPTFIRLRGKEAAQVRSDELDRLSRTARQFIQRYPSGLDEETIERRQRNRRRILAAFNAEEMDWENYAWHLHNVIRNAETLGRLVHLTPDEAQAIEAARLNHIPFAVTPFYASLMDRGLDRQRDHAVRAQVIPTPDYIRAVSAIRGRQDLALDFMGEHDTSPVDMITRRYPRIAVLKPYPSCAQICVYCQRNWELEQVPERAAEPSWVRLQRAMTWLENHEEVSEVLLTGGDPMIMSDKIIEGILSRLSRIEHIERIRIGTRVPVVLPQRITEKLSDMVARYHVPGSREICIVTHFEHTYEVTPEAMHAVQQFRRRGIVVYNQQVFTLENSRRFETVALRIALRKIGVDPYYTFNAKGKEETRSFRAPIARLLQERKEEARLFPGLDRTDEAVFNVPRLGKNYLSHWQDRDLIMIRPDGGRVYEFHPWEKFIAPKNTYLHVDVPILEYLQELERRGEDKRDYKTIWYYF